MSVKLPPIIRCKNCSSRLNISRIGFLYKERYWCDILDREVYLEDGCTFGTKGPSRNATVAPEVYLDHNSTCDKGCHDEML